MTSNDSSDGGSGRSEGEVRALRDEVAQLVSQDAPPAIDLGALRASLKRELEAERGLRADLRSRPTPVRIAIAGTAVLALTAVLAFAALRPDFGVYPLARMAAIVLFITGVVALDLVVALWPMQLPALPRWLAPAAIGIGLVGLLALYVLPVAHLDHPASAHAPGLGALFARALPCLAIGGTAALAIFALLRALDRGGEGRALLAAACGGLAANLGLQVHCPVTAPAHLLIGHLGVIVLLMIAVALYRSARKR